MQQNVPSTLDLIVSNNEVLEVQQVPPSIADGMKEVAVIGNTTTNRQREMTRAEVIDSSFAHLLFDKEGEQGLHDMSNTSFKSMQRVRQQLDDDEGGSFLY